MIYICIRVAGIEYMDSYAYYTSCAGSCRSQGWVVLNSTVFQIHRRTSETRKEPPPQLISEPFTWPSNTITSSKTLCAILDEMFRQQETTSSMLRTYSCISICRIYVPVICYFPVGQAGYLNVGLCREQEQIDHQLFFTFFFIFTLLIFHPAQVLLASVFFFFQH